MTKEEKITNGLGKLLNRNDAYVLGKEIKLVLIDTAEMTPSENTQKDLIDRKSAD